MTDPNSQDPDLEPSKDTDPEEVDHRFGIVGRRAIRFLFFFFFLLHRGARTDLEDVILEEDGGDMRDELPRMGVAGDFLQRRDDAVMGR